MEAKVAAKQAIDHLSKTCVGSAISKSVLFNTGQYYWDKTYKGTDSSSEFVDFEAIYNMHKHVEALGSISPEQAATLEHMLRVPDSLIAIIGSARWVDQGLPVIRLGHKRLAALMATTISRDNLQYVKAPWKAFYIELPPDLLYIVDEGKRFPIKGVLVHTVFHPKPVQDIPRGYTWNWLAVTDTVLTQWCVNNPLENMLGFENPGSYWDDISLPHDAHDSKIQTLIGRLICAICLMMSSPENFKEKLEPALPKKHRPQHKLAAAEPPRFRVFTDTQKVDVDVRPAITSYLQGGPKAKVPSSRVLVTGHFKRQPYGPHSSLRKVIWIEPYWTQGSAEALIKPRVFEVD